MEPSADPAPDTSKDNAQANDDSPQPSLDSIPQGGEAKAVDKKSPSGENSPPTPMVDSIPRQNSTGGDESGDAGAVMPSVDFIPENDYSGE